MTDLRRVRPREERRFRASADDPPGLVVAYLSELLLAADDGFVARRISVTSAGDPPTSLTARAVGEPFDPARHPARIEVKAVTFHGLSFDPARGRARVIVDI